MPIPQLVFCACYIPESLQQGILCWRSKDSTPCHTHPQLATGRTIYVSGNMFAWITRAMRRLSRPQWFIQNLCFCLCCLKAFCFLQILGKSGSTFETYIISLQTSSQPMTQKRRSVQHLSVSFVALFAYVFIVYLTTLLINHLYDKRRCQCVFMFVAAITDVKIKTGA